MFVCGMEVYQGKEKDYACISVPKSNNILLYFPNQYYLLLCPPKDLGVINEEKTIIRTTL